MFEEKLQAQTSEFANGERPHTSMPKGYFVTATGTDVGKTFITGLLVKKWRDSGIDAGYYKAALSGAEFREGKWIAGDADYVKRIANLPDTQEQLVSYVYKDRFHRIWPHKKKAIPLIFLKFRQTLTQPAPATNSSLPKVAGESFAPSAMMTRKFSSKISSRRSSFRCLL